MPTGKEVTWKPEDVLTVSRIKQEIERFARLVEVPSEGQNGPAAMYRLEGAQGLIGFISPVSRHFCGKCNRLRLTSDGKLRTCLFCDDEIDLREYLRNGCGDEKLIERLRLALGKKPQRHEVNTQYFKKCQRNMNSIGG